MKCPAYPKYKDSGVQWLGEVPEHWEVKRLKYAATINDEALPETTDPDYEFTYVDIGSVSPVEGITNMEPMIFENAPSRARRKVAPGDTIVSTVRTYLRAIASIPETTESLIVSTGFAVVRPRKLSSVFLAYALRESSFIESVVARSTGVSYPAVNASEIGDIAIPLPSEDEQTAIADFLDRETGRIDTLVAKKRRLVALLGEKRTALISRTVTRGLPHSVTPAEAGVQSSDTNMDSRRSLPSNVFIGGGNDDTPRFKDSGIEWMGEVPEGWEIVPLGFLVTLKGGATPDKSNSDYWEGPIPWISPKDMKIAKICDAQDHVSDDALRDSALVLLPESSVLIVVRGMILAHSFPVALTTGPVTINQDMKALICGSKLFPQYLVWLLMGSSKVLVSLAGESAHGTRKLETATVTNFPVSLPSLPEQTAIAAYLDRETAKIDQLVTKVEAAIARLLEYRTALITAAVTGKIDVRDCRHSRGACPRPRSGNGSPEEVTSVLA